MNSQIKSQHWNDPSGNPCGGCTFGNGFAISWQNGPLGRGAERKEPNGAFVEDIIRAATERLEYYQSSRFSCDANAYAIAHLRLALDSLNRRTKEREDRAVEGTHSA